MRLLQADVLPDGNFGVFTPLGVSDELLAQAAAAVLVSLRNRGIDVDDVLAELDDLAFAKRVLLPPDGATKHA